MVHLVMCRHSCRTGYARCDFLCHARGLEKPSGSRSNGASSRNRIRTFYYVSPPWQSAVDNLLLPKAYLRPSSERLGKAVKISLHKSYGNILCSSPLKCRPRSPKSSRLLRQDTTRPPEHMQEPSARQVYEQQVSLGQSKTDLAASSKILVRMHATTPVCM